MQEKTAIRGSHDLPDYEDKGSQEATPIEPCAFFIAFRYLAATWGGDGRWFMRGLGGSGRTHRLGKTSTRKGGNLIEYADEDPAIAEMFNAALKKAGVPNRMKG